MKRSTSGNALALVASRLDSPSALARLSNALPAGSRLTAERQRTLLFGELRKSPGLLRCDPESLVNAVVQATELGLQVGSALGHVYLVPFKGSCQLIIGYKGLVELARRTGQISTIYAAIVHERDRFEYELGLVPKLWHVPELTDPGLPTHAYAVAKLSDGEAQFDVMSALDIENVRKRSPSGSSSSSPWSSDWPEMAKKTVLRRLCKLLPMTTEAAAILASEEIFNGRRGRDYQAVPSFDFGSPQVFDKRAPDDGRQNGKQGTSDPDAGSDDSPIEGELEGGTGEW